MSSFRKAICTKCFQPFTYLYKGGRPKQKCLRCKNKSFNAYQKTVIFEGADFPSPPWGLTKNGSGNITRWFNGMRLVLYEDHGYFGLCLDRRGREKGEHFHSGLPAETNRVPEAIVWAERKAQAFRALYAA